MPSRVVRVSPSGRGAHHQAGAAQPIQVERVRRLPAFQHHVVGDVDDVGDRPHPRECEPALHPLRRRSHRHADAPGREPGRTVGSVDHDRDVVGVTRDVDGGLGHGERQIEVRGEIPCHPGHRHRVGPVRRDRQVEDHLVQTELVAHVGAELGVGPQREDAVVVVAEPELARRAEHAVAHLAADLAPLEREAARQRRARRCVRHDHAVGDVRRAAHDRGGAVAELDVAELELVGVGVRPDGEDARHPHAGDLLTRRLEPFDLEAEPVERLRDRARLGRERHEVGQPGQGDTHQGAPISTGRGSGRRCRRTS